MLDIGWSEYLFIGILALVLLGPKELPIVLRTIGRFVAKAREISNSLQEQFYNLEQEDALKESSLHLAEHGKLDLIYPLPHQLSNVHMPIKQPKAFPLPWV
ncbi:MAG: Sec-independent protein translocase protein TatB [Alphaproteobacteria bacterium]|nr:Sec-independent protein translocase protein TatB [Alphaproteobacteria bacterium]